MERSHKRLQAWIGKGFPQYVNEQEGRVVDLSEMVKGDQGKVKKWGGKGKRSKVVTIVDEQESRQEQPLVRVHRELENKQLSPSHKGRGRAGI